MAVGKRLRAVREELGLSQREFADRCGVSRRAQINFESGENMPGGTYLVRAAAFGCDVAFILVGRMASASDDEDQLLRMVREMPEAERGRVLRALLK